MGLRLSDGTLLFAPNAFNTGAQINKATYNMLDLDGGLKWRGWSLDAEYYFRWLGNFDVTGTIPVTSLFDHGFQVYASTMLKPDYWQASGGTIFGQYRIPWDLAAGLTYFPFGHKEVHMNGQASIRTVRQSAIRQFRIRSAAPAGFSRLTLARGFNASGAVKFAPSTSLTPVLPATT